MNRPWSPEGRARVLPRLLALVLAAVAVPISLWVMLHVGVGTDWVTVLRQVWAGWASGIPVLGVGLAFGLKHALDADHLAAVSTILGESHGLWRSSLVGAVWGLGHTLALLAVGVVVVLFQVRISEGLAQALELLVACMLIWLGASALWKVARGGQLHLHAHQHGPFRHVHPHAHLGEREQAHTHHGLQPGFRSLVVGMVHGLAGSAALMLLVLTTIPSPALGLLYIAVFGLGSIGGMVVMSVLVSLPLKLTAERFGRAHATLRAAASLLSLGIGSAMVYEIGFASGWLWS